MVEIDAHPEFALLSDFKDKIMSQNWTKWEKTISFLQGWAMLLNFLAEVHFYGQVVKI